MSRNGKVHFVEGGIIMWWCSACKTHHGADSRWKFDGNTESPTFSPSFLVQGHLPDHPNGGICHSFVTAGQVQYLDDSTHELKGQTVPLTTC